MKHLLYICLVFIAMSCRSQQVIVSDECNSKSTNDSLLINYKQYEAPAEYPGGNDELQKYIKKKIENVAYEIPDKTQSVMYVILKFNKDGIIIGHKVIRDIPNCDKCEAIALDIIEDMPQWLPAYIVETDGVKKFIDSEKIIEIKF